MPPLIAASRCLATNKVPGAWCLVGPSHWRKYPYQAPAIWASGRVIDQVSHA
jgi:hypothetical protein